MKKLLSVLFIACLVLTGCSKEETQRITIDKNLIDILGDTPEQMVEDIKGNGEDYCTDVYVNDDQSITIELTADQREHMKYTYGASLNAGQQSFKNSGKNNHIIYDAQDFLKADIYADPAMDKEDLEFYIMAYQYYGGVRQLLANTEGYEWHVTVNVYNSLTNKLVKTFENTSDFTITAEEWNQSK